MGWGKAVLIFQAVATMIIGILFFISVIGTPLCSPVDFADMAQRLNLASYILIFIALIELIIISRFV